MPGRQAGSGFGKYNAESPTQGSKRFNSPVRRNTFSYLVIINPCVYLHRYHCTICIEEEKDKREGKGFRCCLGDVLECRTSHLAARMIGRQVVGRISIWGGWGFDVVWTRWSSIFLKHPFCQASALRSSFSSNHPGAKSSAAWHWMNSVPQTGATTLAYSPVCFFFLWQISMFGLVW